MTCNKNFPLYIDYTNRYPQAKEVSNMIRKSGGKVFIAHIFTYPLKDYINYLDKLREENIIDGIEVYYSNFTNEQIKILEKYCEKYNLLISAGSDCHGDKGKERKLGLCSNNKPVSKKIICNWIK